MIRFQVSLTEAQLAQLRRIADERGVSIATVVRKAVDALDVNEPKDRFERFLGADGAFSSGPSNTSEEHDAALEDAYLDW